MSARTGSTARSRRTRAVLVDAALRVFSERPVDAVTVDDLVQAAGLAKGTFYNHFTDRDALVDALCADLRAKVEEAVDLANAEVEDPARRMARAFCTYLRHAVDAPREARFLVRVQGGHSSLDAQLNRGLVDDLSEGLAAGRFTIPTIEAGLLYVLGVTQLGLIRVTREPTVTLAVSLGQQMCGMLLRGLGMSGQEADLLSAQASEELIRRGGAAGAAAATAASPA